MTLLFQRATGQGPVTHAFVVGVGAYPHMAPAWGGDPGLGNVPELPSAADSAKMMCAWLLENCDQLAAPLASLEALISDPDDKALRFNWNPPTPIDAATSANVEIAGAAWFNRLRLRNGDVALFYCCGHGAAHGTGSILFLEDLNEDERNPWVHLDVGELAEALRRAAGIKCAFMFSDTCSEYLPRLAGGGPLPARFYPPPRPDVQARDKVSLILAAPSPELAFAGAVLDNLNNVVAKAGRFTQVLLKALDGFAARETDFGWAVLPDSLPYTLKQLRTVYFPHWDNNPQEPPKLFEPSPAFSHNDVYPLTLPHNPVLPVVVWTNPEDRNQQFRLEISFDASPGTPPLAQRAAEQLGPWLVEIPAAQEDRFAIAIAADPAGERRYLSRFSPRRPLFRLEIPVSER
jgi:hypothetical protein